MHGHPQHRGPGPASEDEDDRCPAFPETMLSRAPVEHHGSPNEQVLQENRQAQHIALRVVDNALQLLKNLRLKP